MQIDRGIFYLSPVKDAAEIVIQVFTDDEGMSRQLVKTAFYPPIKDEAGTGIFHFVNLFRRESPRDLTFFYKFFHRIGKIRITNDIIRFYKITFCHNPFRSSVFRFNLLHRRIVPNASSQLLKKFCHLLSHRMHTAFDKPSPIKQFYHRNDIKNIPPYKNALKGRMETSFNFSAAGISAEQSAHRAGQKQNRRAEKSGLRSK